MGRRNTRPSPTAAGLGGQTRGARATCGLSKPLHHSSGRQRRAIPVTLTDRRQASRWGLLHWGGTSRHLYPQRLPDPCVAQGTSIRVKLVHGGRIGTSELLHEPKLCRSAELHHIEVYQRPRPPKPLRSSDPNINMQARSRHWHRRKATANPNRLSYQISIQRPDQTRDQIFSI